MLTPNMYVQSLSNPFAQVPPSLRTNTVDVFYATDRQPLSPKDQSLAYGYGRSPSLAFGSTVVEIGQDISWDDLVTQSREQKRSEKLPLRIRSITEQGRFPETPLPFDRHNGKVTIDAAAQATQDQVADDMRRELQRRLALTSHKVAYVYILRI